MFCGDKVSAVVYIPFVPETPRSKKSKRKGTAFGARASNKPADRSLHTTGEDVAKAGRGPEKEEPNPSKPVDARRAAMISEMEIEKLNETMGTIFLDPDQKSPRAQDFEERLYARIVGQERAVRRMSGLYQIFLAGMNPPNRPIGTMLFLGPTGSGKTRVIEAAAEVLYGDSNAIVKIDCAEFQHSHEIAKLIGSPPGYLGHRETAPMLTQEN